MHVKKGRNFCLLAYCMALSLYLIKARDYWFFAHTNIYYYYRTHARQDNWEISRSSGGGSGWRYLVLQGWVGRFAVKCSDGTNYKLEDGRLILRGIMVFGANRLKCQRDIVRFYYSMYKDRFLSYGDVSVWICWRKVEFVLICTILNSKSSMEKCSLIKWIDGSWTA